MAKSASAVMGRLPEADALRQSIAPQTAPVHKAVLGQFMTPLSTARFMASLFHGDDREECRLLDAGAGLGALSCAFLDRWHQGGFGFKRVEAQAFELDDALIPHLEASLGGYSNLPALHVEVTNTDFIERAVNALQFDAGMRFTHVILNPPYKKISSESRYRMLLRQVGIETVNLYSAFVALALDLLVPGGQLAAIVPRSFCNGPYYRPFREFVLERAAIQRMHLFASRSSAFKDDGVLQENIIILLQRGARQGDVVVSTSTDDGFADLAEYVHPFHRIVFPDDSEQFIHVPTSIGRCAIEQLEAIRFSLSDLGLNVSTGPVVGFRVREHMRAMPEHGTVPLLYPGHFGSNGVEWPKPGAKKPNAIARNADTERWLYPTGSYCVVRRFSSKEERRRIVAGVVDPVAFGDATMLGFENHLNVFHSDRHGLQKALAVGLAAFLNTTAVDEIFRRFNGHTQVNATDLKQMRYPGVDTLMALGEWAMSRCDLSQDDLDARFSTLAQWRALSGSVRKVSVLASSMQ